MDGSGDRPAALATVAVIVDELTKVEAASTNLAWFAGKNPLLDDRAPALVVGENPDAVRRAARHFVANG